MRDLQGAIPSPWQERRRGHQVVGPVTPHQQRRHYTAAIIIAAVGVALAAGASAYGIQQQRQATQYNRKVAENQALSARQAAQANADDRRDKLRRVLAQQRANIGGSNVEGSLGSPLLVQIDSARQAELEALRIQHGGEQAALGFETQAAYAKYAGRQAQVASGAQAGTSLLSGTTSVVGAYQARPPTT